MNIIDYLITLPLMLWIGESNLAGFVQPYGLMTDPEHKAYVSQTMTPGFLGSRSPRWVSLGCGGSMFMQWLPVLPSDHGFDHGQGCGAWQLRSLEVQAGGNPTYVVPFIKLWDRVKPYCGTEPFIASVMIGGNDAIGCTWNDPVWVREDVIALHNALDACGAVVKVWATPMPIESEWAGEVEDQFGCNPVTGGLDVYDPIILEECEKRENCIPVNSRAIVNESHLGPDAVHLTGDGHTAYAEGLRPYLLEAYWKFHRSKFKKGKR